MKEIKKIRISIEDAVNHCDDENTLIPSSFLSTFPNNFGINLCAIECFEVEMTDDNQYSTLKVIFKPVDEKTGVL